MANLCRAKADVTATTEARHTALSQANSALFLCAGASSRYNTLVQAVRAVAPGVGSAPVAGPSIGWVPAVAHPSSVDGESGDWDEDTAGDTDGDI